MKAYQLATEKEYFGKAESIQSFLEVNTEEPNNRHYIAKRTHGTRSMRAVGNEKRTGRGFTKQKRLTLYQGKPEEQTLFRKGHHRVLHETEDGPQQGRE